MAENIQKTFINKYKPRYLDDFQFEGNLTYILKTMIEIDSLNVLVVGASNSGKTTLLYAIIREYYGMEHNHPELENNILFINNLKEQGIQYYRNEMKSFCQLYSSITGKKKLIVIDDLDTINQQSQEVFRSYIDKYGNNVSFVCVCSNVQKVIESLQSRLQMLHLPSPNRGDCLRILRHIVKEESINIDEMAVEYLLDISQNSVRNVINHLEKMWILDCKIDIGVCKELCFNIPYSLFEEYVVLYNIGADGANGANGADAMENAITILYKINSEFGYSVIDILDEFFIFVKMTDLLSEEMRYRMIPVICEYIMHFHLLHEDSIELALFTRKLWATRNH
jgi:DNA polymerase III delta prime subunit